MTTEEKQEAIKKICPDKYISLGHNSITLDDGFTFKELRDIVNLLEK